MTHWTEGYIGLPFLAAGRTRLGCDCWGLVRIVLEEFCRIALPAFDGEGIDALEADEIEAMIGAGTAHPVWHEITDPRDFDVVVFMAGDFDAHVGVVCGTWEMLHVALGGSSRITRTDRGRWAGRTPRYFRHEALL